jgi:hypothetical protein
VGRVLIAVGVLLWIFSFLLAFTAFGVIAALLGLVCLGIGVTLLVTRPNPPLPPPRV